MPPIVLSIQNCRGPLIQYLTTPFFSVILGLCVGSFLNVCLFRWKSGGQVFTPCSFCTSCKNEIRWFDNIPIFSFLFLKGHCRFCEETISWQYPLIEIATSVFFFIATMTVSETGLMRISSFVFVSFLILLTISDLKWKLLPHPFTNLFAVTGFIFQVINTNVKLTSLYVVAGGFMIVGAIIFTLTQIFHGVLGGGDVKMMLALSVWLGVSKSVYVLLLAFGTGGFVALVLLAFKKVNRKSTMPFGPFLALGAYVTWFLPSMVDYLRMAL